MEVAIFRQRNSCVVPLSSNLTASDTLYLDFERSAEWHRYSVYTGTLYHGSLTTAGARLIASAGCTDRGLLSNQLRPVDGRFKSPTMTMTSTFAAMVPALSPCTYMTALFPLTPTRLYRAFNLSRKGKRSCLIIFICNNNLIYMLKKRNKNKSNKSKIKQIFNESVI